MTRETMSGVVLTGHGGPEKLIWRDDLPMPVPAPGEALIRVHAAGINNTDINTRLGWYSDDVTGGTDANQTGSGDDGGWSGALQFPLIQGGDLCGAVVAVGDPTHDGWIGRRVTAPLCLPRPTMDDPVGMTCIGSEMNGAFAQFCCLPADDLYDVTESPMTDTQIAAIPCAYGTAEALLDRAGVREGDRVLVTGASGGVGMAAVELASLRGAHVIGVTSRSKSEAVLAAGAAETLDRDEPAGNECIDCVIDVVGGPKWAGLIQALKRGGRYAVAGAIAGPIVEMDLRKIYLKDLTLSGSTYQPPAVFQKLAKLINGGKLNPLVSKTYPLRDIHRAQTDFMAKTFPGKLVLIPPAEDEKDG
ncbi:alcohol dehydrogenase family protein [Shimia biformata]|uniref:alcohol dehydrogenase family protein n=1 Tax=Shimia biformata TaxID=1294299 RepID=UPI001950F15B|nr:alcohol dehydrogenase family protein [Shimia biformata]